MVALNRLLLGPALAAVFSMPVLAASNEPGTLLIVWPDGTAGTFEVSDAKTLDTAMTGATPMTDGTPTPPASTRAGGVVMVLIEGGKAYSIPDRKMDNGKMMSENVSNRSPTGTSN
jgi:hypothetical protein